MSRRLLQTFFGWALLTGCQTARFEPLVFESALRSLRCSTLRVTQLETSWAYRVQGCAQQAYYRCVSKAARNCCRRVETDQDAIRLLRPAITHPGGPFPETMICEQAGREDRPYPFEG